MTRKIRVLQLGSPTGIYGAERWILALTKYLDPDAVESTVGVLQDDPRQTAPLLTHAAALGAKTARIDCPGRINWQAVRRLRQFLVEQRIDILHTHFYKADIIGLLAARGTGTRTVTTPHGWSSDAGAALRLYEALDRLAFRWFDAVVPLSRELHDGLLGSTATARRLHLITNGVDLDEIDALPRSSAPELDAWRRDGAHVFGYIGQLIQRKGLDVLLRAFAKAEVPNRRLAVVGEGDQRAALVDLARTLGIDERVSFFGYREDRLSLLLGFDTFVLPSRLEGLPRCVMEAMAARVPVAGTAIPGMTDLIDHGHSGLLFPKDDVDACAEALTRIADRELSRRFAAAGREAVEQKYSARSMARAYLSLFQRLVEPEYEAALA